MDKGEGKQTDDTPLSPQWLSLAPQRSSSLSDSGGLIQSALLAADHGMEGMVERPSSRSSASRNILSSQWSSSDEGRKPGGGSGGGNLSLPSELLFPSEPYWKEGKKDVGWHKKKNNRHEESFESHNLYSPGGRNRPTATKPREISRGWGYLGDKSSNRREHDREQRGSFSGSYGTSQEGYENFKPSSSFDKKLSSSSERKSERWERWNSSDGSWRSRGHSQGGGQSNFSAFSRSIERESGQHFARGSGRDFGGRDRARSQGAAGNTLSSSGGRSTSVLVDINQPGALRYSRRFMHGILNDLLDKYSLLPLPEGADLEDVGHCENKATQEEEEEEEVPEWAREDSSLPTPDAAATDFSSLGFKLNPDELWKDISVDVGKPDQNQKSLLQGLIGEKPAQPISSAADVVPETKASPDPVPKENSIGEQWIYKDPKGITQGPFSTSQMLEWYQAKFFPLELPVAPLAEPAMFQPLSFWLVKWGIQLEPSPIQNPTLSNVAMQQGASFAEHGYNTLLKQDPHYMKREEGAVPIQQQYAQNSLQGMHSQRMSMQPELMMQNQMLSQNMMYNKGLAGSQIPFAGQMQMPGAGSSMPQVVPQAVPQPPAVMEARSPQMYNQFSGGNIAGQQDSIQQMPVHHVSNVEPPKSANINMPMGIQGPDRQELEHHNTPPAPPVMPPMPPMPPMPAMPVGVASLEQIEARMRDKPRSATGTVEYFDGAGSLGVPEEQMVAAMSQPPQPPPKFWGDLPESKISMADIMNEEKKKAEKEAVKISKPLIVPRRIDVPVEPQPDIISSGKSNWAEKPNQSAAPQSLAEILEEEEKMRARNKLSGAAQPNSGNSWAAKLGGMNSYPGPASPLSAASSMGVHPEKAAAKVSNSNVNDGFEDVTRRRKKHGKSTQNVDMGRSATKTIEREVKNAPALQNTKSLSSIQSEELERRKLAMNFSGQAAVQQADDELFWEMPAEPQQSRFDGQTDLGIGNPWSRKQQSMPSPNPTNQGSFPSLSSQVKSSNKMRSNEPRRVEKEASSASNPISNSSMSDEFTKWCKEQMLLLNGSDDLTLVDFLMSLPSEKEIREYVEFYLGKSAKASKFTTEFLFRMEEETKPSSDSKAFEGQNSSMKGSGNKKKGKKKGKKLDASLLGFNTGIHLYTDLEVE